MPSVTRKRDLRTGTSYWMSRPMPRIPTTHLTRTAELKSSPLFLFAEHTVLMKSDVLGDSWTTSSAKGQSLI